MASLNTNALDAILGAYCRENAREIIEKVYLNLPFTSKYKHIPNIRDELPLMRLTTASILQQRNSAVFSPTTDAISLDARILKVRGAKVDLELDVQPLWRTHFGHVLSPSGQNLIDFVEIIISGVIPKLREELHTQVAFKGVYAANTANTPTAVTDGWLKLVLNEVAAGTLSVGNGNLVPTGPITASNAVDALRSMWRALPEIYRTTECHMYVSPDIYEFYRWDYDAQYNQSVVYTGVGNYGSDIIMSGSNTLIINEPGLSGSQRVILTLPMNMTYGTNDAEDIFYKPRIEWVDRLVHLLLDFGIGFQFAQTDGGVLIVNDQV